MQTLVLCDDYWHPARVPRAGLTRLGSSHFEFNFLENAREWSPELMTGYPLTILTKSNNVSSTDRSTWMTEAIEAAFVEYVRQGNGLFAIHSGTADYEDSPKLRSLLGGIFKHHPDQCMVSMSPLAGHPLSTGVDPFTIKDEHYFMTEDDPHVDVFMTTASIHGEQLAAWRRTEGSGRVAVLTPGHNVEVWLHPSFQAMLENILRWCARLS